MRWTDQDLKLLERALASVLGPMARVLVKKTAASMSGNLDDLVQGLAAHLASREERRRFMDEIRAQGGLRASPTVDALEDAPLAAPVETDVPQTDEPTPVLLDEVQPLTPEFLVQATQVLSAAMGPMARVLVKQAEARANGLEAFIDALVHSVPDSVDRGALRTALRARR